MFKQIADPVGQQHGPIGPTVRGSRFRRLDTKNMGTSKADPFRNSYQLVVARLWVSVLLDAP
jgi:hypothetical protein